MSLENYKLTVLNEMGVLKKVSSFVQETVFNLGCVKSAFDSRLPVGEFPIKGYENDDPNDGICRSSLTSNADSSVFGGYSAKSSPEGSPVSRAGRVISLSSDGGTDGDASPAFLTGRESKVSMPLKISEYGAQQTIYPIVENPPMMRASSLQNIASERLHSPVKQQSGSFPRSSFQGMFKQGMLTSHVPRASNLKEGPSKEAYDRALIIGSSKSRAANI
ncbi:hypothetical protein HOH87_03940 [bacterium]|nr:hypothetical protein [bacterium]